jgi:alginate O-acetyltransferase complex protein AlgI
LARALGRLRPWEANIATFFIVMVGWTIFRSTASLHQAGAMLALMAQPFTRAPSAQMIPSYYWLAALIGAGVVVAQRAVLSIEGFNWMDLARRHALLANTLLALLFVAALAKGLADPFKPFIYFRF